MHRDSQIVYDVKHEAKASGFPVELSLGVSLPRNVDLILFVLGDDRRVNQRQSLLLTEY